MNGANNVEERLRKTLCSTPAEADERILADATAEFERASKVQTSRSWRIAAAAAAVMVLFAVAVVFLIGRGEAEQATPRVEKQPEPAAEQLPVEEPTQPRTQPVRRTNNEQTPKRTAAAPQPQSRHQEVDNQESKLLRMAEYASAGDVNALVAQLDSDDLTSRMAAVNFLSKMSDERAVSALDELAENLDPNNPEDHFLAALLGVKDFGKSEETAEKAQGMKEAEKAPEPNTPAMEEEHLPEHYVTGWLTDVSGYAVEGRIQVGQLEAATDANGAFMLKRPSFAEFTSSFGYAVSLDGQVGAVFHWSADKDLNDIEIVCRPFASASGFVVDANGWPVSDFHIEIIPEVNEQPAYARGEFKGPWEVNMETDGSFEITSIPTGCPLVLIVSREGLSRQVTLGEPEPGEHLPLGQIILEGSVEEDSIPEQG